MGTFSSHLKSIRIPNLYFELKHLLSSLIYLMASVWPHLSNNWCFWFFFEAQSGIVSPFYNTLCGLSLCCLYILCCRPVTCALHSVFSEDWKTYFVFKWPKNVAMLWQASGFIMEPHLNGLNSHPGTWVQLSALSSTYCDKACKECCSVTIHYLLSSE